MGKIVYNGREYLSAGTASTMQGATSTTDGVSGLVPQPLIADKDKVLKGDGTWGDASEVEANPSGTATDTLQKVDIDGVIYDIQGGGGGGSNLILDAAIYSTDEKQIGIWIDKKPIYQKTWHFSTPITLNANTWYTTNISVNDFNFETLIRIVGNNVTDVYEGLQGEKGQNYIELINNRYAVITELTILYTKTTDAAGSGGYQAWGFSPIIYSTEEREVGVWIDNKPLYQKTFIITSKQSQIDISSLNIDTYVKSESVYRIGSLCFEMPRLSDITQNYDKYISTYYTELNDGIISFLWGTNVSSIDELHFTIQYTKTTDTAGSGSYNTLGVPTVYYTADEQVIGTWFGETLYEKIINFDYNDIQSSTSSSCEIYINVPDIRDTKESLILFEGGIIQFPYFVSQTIFIGGFTQTETDTFHISLRYSSSVYSELNAYLTDCRVKLQYTKTTD